MNLNNTFYEIAQDVIKNTDLSGSMDLENISEKAFLDNIDSTDVRTFVEEKLTEYIQDNVRDVIRDVLLNETCFEVPSAEWEDALDSYVDQWLENNGPELMEEIVVDYLNDLMQSGCFWENFVHIEGLAAQIIDEA